MGGGVFISTTNPMKKKKKKKEEETHFSLGGYTHGEELIINLLSTFFQIYIYILWININFLDNKKRRRS